jgi:tRNA threonylcarbamoyladenosine biosynthesis protein TsaE
MYVPDTGAMEALGARLARPNLKGGIVYLAGELGTGKTTIVRGLLQALGISRPIKSPTYTLVEPYRVGELWIYHFDLYRLFDPEELEYLGIRDYLEEEVLCLIEWPERGRGFLPSPDLTIQIWRAGDGRRVECIFHTPVGTRLWG